MKTILTTTLILLCVSLQSLTVKASTVEDGIITVHAKENLLCISPEESMGMCKQTVSFDYYSDSFTYPIYSPLKKQYKIIFKTDIDSLVCSFDDYADFNFNLSIDELEKPISVTVQFTKELPNKISNNEKIYFLSLIWSEIRYNFAFYDELNFDFDSLYNTYIPIVLNTKNDIEYYNTLKRLTATLKDGHTQVVDDYFIYKGAYPEEFKFFGEELYVISTFDNDKFIPLKSKVLKINAIPYMQYIEEKVLPYVKVKSPYAVKNTVAYLLGTSKVFPDTLLLTVETPNKKIATYNLISQKALTIEFENMIYKYITIHPIDTNRNRQEPISLSWLKDNIAVLTINTFSPFDESYSALLDSLLEAASVAKKLIIDIRENDGGSTEMSYPILKRLCKQKAFLSLAAQTRINNGAGKANGNWLEEYEDFYLMKAYQTDSAEWIEVESDIKRYEMPVVILVSEYTASAAEDFLIMLYEWKERPTIIGRPTYGSTGSPLVIELPQDGYARICTRRCLFPYSMKPFTCIKPDIEVIYTLEEYASGIDKEMEKALEVLNNK
jgi:hypothetical protein